MSSTSELTVSVVVTAYNAERFMPSLLTALEAQTLPAGQFEVVIADDASTDRTAELVEHSRVARLVRAPRRQGEAATRNLAVQASVAPLIAITDADCTPVPEWLAAGVEAMHQGDAALIGGHVDLDLPARPTLPALTFFARRLNQHTAVTEAGYAVTANLFVRREVFHDVGYFTDGLRAGVDVEWVLRATAAGHRLAYSPQAAVRHPVETSLRGLARRSYRDGYGTSQWSRLARGPLRAHGSAWKAPETYRPMRGVAAAPRMRGAGIELSRTRRAALDVTNYAGMQVPKALGSMIAELRGGRF
jgi:glycosyltransferase involved in cell wall biosynthesis